MYKGPMDKAKESGFEGGRRGLVELGKVLGGQWRLLYLNNIKKKEKKKSYNNN